MRPVPAVSILTSGIGLGVYMPALFIQSRLRAAGVEAEVEVLEGYYTPEGQQRHLAHKQAYHDNFDLALMAHRMARSVEGSLDQPRVDALVTRWAEERRRHFIVWSGFLLPILERLRRDGASDLAIDVCRIDAVVSASFRVHEGLAPDAREIWLWSWEDRRTVYEIPVGDQVPLAFPERDHRLVVHGGGWSLGTYRDAFAAVGGTGWACDVVVHETVENTGARPGDRAFMVDRDWRTWHRRDGAHTFPPFGEVGAARLAGGADKHALFELIRRSKAIVSKPGGGTLIDSLASATPVVLLEPYGYAEARNGALWEELGFAVPYASWRDGGFDPDVLERLHQNLLRRPRGPDYPLGYAERLLGSREAA
jgi:hypothetical protein